MKTLVLGLGVAASLALTSIAGAKSFDLKDQKGVNNIVFLLDAPLESINGTASGISGTLNYDPAKPEATKGKIVVAVDSMEVANSKMKEHMMGGYWLEQSKYPEITYELEGLSDVKKDGDTVSAMAHGTMTIKGVSQHVMAPLSFTYLPGAMKARQDVEGDIVVIRSKFSVKRGDFGIQSGQREDKVANEVELRLSVAGFAPKG